MSDAEENDKTPSEELAEILTNALLDKGLILKEDAPHTSLEIASGKLKAEDWRLLIEKALDKEVSDE